MTNENEQLARRAVACARWRWMDGMLAYMPDATWSLRITEGGVEDFIGRRDGAHSGLESTYDGPCGGFFPDLTDPATVGCLMALVREAWGSGRMYTRAREWWGERADGRHHVQVYAAPTAPAPILHGLCEEEWHVWEHLVPRIPPYARERGRGRTEAEALVAALECAPLPSDPTEGPGELA